MENQRSFCSIVLGDHIRRLIIPPPFVAEHGAFFPETVTVRTENGSQFSWPVKIAKIGGGFYALTNGWHKFMEDNALEFANFLLLQFVEDSRIIVSVFNYNGLKRKTAVYRFTWHNRLKSNMVIKKSVCKEIRLYDETEVRMRNMKGNIVQVKVFKSKDGRVGLGDGWAEFVRASNMVGKQKYQLHCMRCNQNIQMQLTLVQE